MISENSKAVIDYLRTVNDKNVTSADVAEALNLPKKTVDGCFTMSICRKGLGERVPAEVTNPDGTHAKVNLLKLNEQGMTWDYNAEA